MWIFILLLFYVKLTFIYSQSNFNTHDDRVTLISWAD